MYMCQTFIVVPAKKKYFMLLVLHLSRAVRFFFILKITEEIVRGGKKVPLGSSNFPSACPSGKTFSITFSTSLRGFINEVFLIS